MNLGNVIIVGNSGTLLKKELGPTIDTYDYIVRMGECRIKGYENHVGTRTNMYRMKWFNLFNCEDNTPQINYGKKRDLDFNFDDILFTFQDPDAYSEISYYGYNQEHYLFYPKETHDLIYQNNFRLHHDKLSEIFNFMKNKKMYYFSSPLMERLKTDMNISDGSFWPSAGLCTIYYFLKILNYKTLTIVGLDGFTTNHYWKSQQRFKCKTHSIVHERLYLNKLIKDQQIDVLF